MGTQLGLQDLIVHHGENFNSPSSRPPRMLSLPPNLIEQEERVRAYWMAEILDNVSTVGASWNLSLVSVTESDILPCSDEVWTMNGYSDVQPPNPSISFTNYVEFVSGPLYQVQKFMQQKFDLNSLPERSLWQNKCQELDEILSTWRANLTDSLCKASQSRPGDVARAGFGTNMTLVRCLANFAVISMYQRVSIHNSQHTNHIWPHAAQRCLDAVGDTCETVRCIADKELSWFCPFIICSVFTAARFLLAYAAFTGNEAPPSVDLLIYSMRLLSQRWPLAKRLAKVLRAAALEYKATASTYTIPLQFYNLEYSTIDIDEALKAWYMNSES
ncbi:hypothetical protein NA57DRAFT_73697 [Rhizodiscina lignyota]|uniref:Transcription factor domain-containing protein n=1 Tax=Rhizodiscina lignyota TaxID=1504668 RepID=A0A9P4M916_9PEZI|nr:hypothetical protein NA57DRAFT_73697 [Rhizodiscina lignyota]